MNAAPSLSMEYCMRTRSQNHCEKIERQRSFTHTMSTESKSFSMAEPVHTKKKECGMSGVRKWREKINRNVKPINRNIVDAHTDT